MNGSTYRRCGCRDPETGRQLGSRCPKLAGKRHGVWYFYQELPPDAEGKRNMFRRGGYESKSEAQGDLDKVRTLLAIPDADDDEARLALVELLRQVAADRAPIPDVDDVKRQLRAGLSLTSKLTLGDYLDEWLDSQRKIRRGTLRLYRGHVENYIRPYLGHRLLDRLRVSHISDMFDWIDERNEAILEAAGGGERSKLDEYPGLKKRIVGAATQQRIRATLRKALNDAIRRQLITFNPASFVELPSGASPKPIVWTDERVRRWRETGEIPSRVMVWTPAQIGAFLDAAGSDRYYALFHLVAFRGLRRGEACGARRTDLDLDAGILTVARQLVQYGGVIEESDPKTDSSAADVALDRATVTVLRALLTRQEMERDEWGDAYEDSGRIFTWENGAALRPDWLTEHFQSIVAKADLPPIRLHDLRHGAATLALAAGTDMKVVSAMLRHSNIGITANTYTSVLPEVAREAAEAAVALVPRAARVHTEDTSVLTTCSQALELESPGEIAGAV